MKEKKELKDRYIVLEADIPYDWDDYGVWCSFYYDMQEKEIVRSNFGHGTGDSYKGVPWRTAIEQGLTKYEDLVSVVVDHFGGSIIRVLSYAGDFVDKRICLPCTVSRGRKFKGDGIAVRVFEEKSMYYPTKTLCEVLDPVTKVARNICAGYVELKMDNLLDVFKSWSVKNEKLPNLIHQLAYDASYSSCDRETFNRNWRMFVRAVVSEAAVEDLGEYTNIDDEAKAEKLRIKNEQLYNDNIDKVTAWANDKFGGTKSEEEIADIISRTMKKYYTRVS